METRKNTMLRTASVLMAVCALAAIIISAVNTSSTLFIAWGIVFLVFGVFSLGSTFSLLGICNLLGGIVAPVLFLIGGNRNKKQTRSA